MSCGKKLIPNFLGFFRARTDHFNVEQNNTKPYRPITWLIQINNKNKTEYWKIYCKICPFLLNVPFSFSFIGRTYRIFFASFFLFEQKFSERGLGVHLVVVVHACTILPLTNTLLFFLFCLNRKLIPLSFSSSFFSFSLTVPSINRTLSSLSVISEDESLGTKTSSCSVYIEERWFLTYSFFLLHKSVFCLSFSLSLSFQ